MCRPKHSQPHPWCQVRPTALNLLIGLSLHITIIMIIITDLQQQNLFPAASDRLCEILLIRRSKCRVSRLTSHVKDARLIHIHNTIIQGVECVDTLQEVIQVQWKVQR